MRRLVLLLLLLPLASCDSGTEILPDNTPVVTYSVRYKAMIEGDIRIDDLVLTYTDAVGTVQTVPMGSTNEFERTINMAPGRTPEIAYAGIYRPTLGIPAGALFVRIDAALNGDTLSNNTTRVFQSIQSETVDVKTSLTLPALPAQ